MERRSGLPESSMKTTSYDMNGHTWVRQQDYKINSRLSAHEGSRPIDREFDNLQNRRTSTENSPEKKSLALKPCGVRAP